MKKVFSVMAVVLFLSVNAYANCGNYAIAAMQAEFMAYGFDNQAQVNQAIEYYENACNVAGGNIEMPVFL